MSERWIGWSLTGGASVADDIPAILEHPVVSRPGEPPARFWAAFRQLVARSLGPATAAAIYDAPR